MLLFLYKMYTFTLLHFPFASLLLATKLKLKKLDLRAIRPVTQTWSQIWFMGERGRMEREGRWGKTLSSRIILLGIWYGFGFNFVIVFHIKGITCICTLRLELPVKKHREIEVNPTWLMNQSLHYSIFVQFNSVHFFNPKTLICF